MENRLFSEGLHTLGSPPDDSQLSKYLKAYFGDDVPDRVIEKLSSLPEDAPFDLDSFTRSLNLNGEAESLGSKIQEAKEIRDLLSQNSGEISSIIKVTENEMPHLLPPSLFIIPDFIVRNKTSSLLKQGYWCHVYL